MANNYLTPNMNLLVPIPTLEASPNWAYDLNTSLATIDSHNHSTGNGVQITPTGLNINADLTFGNFNAIQLRSTRFTDQGSPLTASAPDLECLYGSSGNLYWNSGGGSQVQITNGGSLAGAAGTITGLPSGTASAAFQSSSGTFQFQSASGVAATIDGGALAVRYSGSYPTLTGNYILLQAPSSISSAYSITLPAASSIPGAGTYALTLNTSGAMGSLSYDGIGQGMTSVGANAIAATMNSTGTTSIVTSMTTSNYNTIVSGVNSVSASGAGTIANAMNTAACNTIINNCNSGSASSFAILTTAGITSAQANTIVSAVTSGSAANSLLSNTTASALIGSHYPVVVNNAQGARFTMAACQSVGGSLNINAGVNSFVNNSAGQFTVTWSQAFTNVPIVVCCIDGATGFVNTSSISTSGCQITTRNAVQTLTNISFNLIAYGYAS